MDAEADRLHPRKRRRPIAAGQVSTRAALVFAGVLWLAAVAVSVLAPVETWWLILVAVGLHVGNVISYSLFIKHAAIADVMSLAMGFVLRVMGGCAAAGVEPSVWLLNVTFFLSMFLAFGKRLGERRLMARLDDDGAGELAIKHRRVQSAYSDVFLQMAVVVTAVTTLVTYAFYIQSREDPVVVGFSLLWLTMLPSTYGLLRAIVTLENGQYDDPTELAYKDKPFQLAGLIFVFITAAITTLAALPPDHSLSTTPNEPPTATETAAPAARTGDDR
jgi:4-hydroxybenzoate polyprenyltransferase